MKRIAIASAVLIVMMLIGATYLLGSEPVPETTKYEIDLTSLRSLARDDSGALPIEIRFENIADGELARGLIMAGEGFDPVAMPRPVFQIMYADGSFALIDTAYGRSAHEANSAGQPYFDAAWEHLVSAMEVANLIVVTHEHGDHLGGVSQHPRPERITKNLRLTTEQLSSRGAIFAPLADALRAELNPLQYDDELAIAPGIVVRKAAGHTPGSQMVFVTLNSGSEFLFVGDVVWNFDAVTELKYRPRLITDFFLGEDREAVLDQIRALRNLHDAGGVSIVVSHDRRTYQNHEISEGFILDEPGTGRP